jgi:hypothetical protein
VYRKSIQANGPLILLLIQAILPMEGVDMYKEDIQKCRLRKVQRTPHIPHCNL